MRPKIHPLPRIFLHLLEMRLATTTRRFFFGACHSPFALQHYLPVTKRSLSFVPPLYSNNNNQDNDTMVSLAHEQTLAELNLPDLIVDEEQQQQQAAEPCPPSKSLRHTLGLPPTTTRNSQTKASTSTSPPPPRHLPPFPAIVGHRGALYAELENTRESFRQCAAWGCEAVELDVFVLKDGNVIVFHGGGSDENPGDLSDYCVQQDGVNILDLDYHQASTTLVFDRNFAEFACPPAKIVAGRIPLLKQVLTDLRGTRTRVKIELKHAGTVQPVLQVVEDAGMVHQVSYSSFQHDLLLELRNCRPSKLDYPTGALFNDPVPKDYLERALTCGATQVHLRYDTCTVTRVQEIRWAGLRSMAWVRGPRGMAEDTTQCFVDIGNEEGAACYQALWETGVDEICVNKPDVAIALRDAPRRKWLPLGTHKFGGALEQVTSQSVTVSSN